jgi:hypothetical protein
MVHRTKKVYGYVVSSNIKPDGVYVDSLSDAKKEMTRQMRKGAKESGVREVKSKSEWFEGTGEFHR